MMSRLPHAPLSEKKRKAPGMAPGVHGVLVSNKRVHLWGPRFVDIGVHHNLKTMFADMAPIQVDDSDDDCVAPPQATCHTTICVEAALAQESRWNRSCRAACARMANWLRASSTCQRLSMSSVGC